MLYTAEEERHIIERAMTVLDGLPDKGGNVRMVEWRDAYGSAHASRFQRAIDHAMTAGYIVKTGIGRLQITEKGKDRIIAIRKARADRIKRRQQTLQEGRYVA
jgi:hypothetical protein